MGMRVCEWDWSCCLAPEPLQGSVGTAADWATMDEAILSPSAHMAEAGGPRNVMLALWRRSGSLGFSDA